MEHVNAVRAALKAAAPVVAIPVEGHAPICIRAKLLKGALRGVTVDRVELLPNRWLKVTGIAEGGVRTCSKFAPMERYTALKMVGEWAIKEREKALKIINQGVLSAQEQRAIKLRKAEQAGTIELRKTEQLIARLYAEAKAHINPASTPESPKDRAEVIARHAQFRANRHNRKRGAVIRWKLKTLREQCAIITTTTKSRKTRKLVTTLKRQDNVIKYAAMLYQIGELEKQYRTLYPKVPHEFEWSPGTIFLEDSWQQKRPNHQAYYLHDEYEHEHFDRSSLVKKLTEALKDRRALTPPADEEFAVTA